MWGGGGGGWRQLKVRRAGIWPPVRRGAPHQGYTPNYSFFCNCMFYQLLRVQHSSSSTQSWGSVLPSIVETRDQNFRGCPLLFSDRNLGYFCTVVDHSRSKMHETCLIIIHDPGIEPGTFGLADECSTTELTLLLMRVSIWPIRIAGSWGYLAGT